MALTTQEIEVWLKKDIPHRVRACLAYGSRLAASLGQTSEWHAKSENEEVARRCATDATWEGRLCAMRWLIDFVGLTGDTNGNPVEHKRPRRGDFGIEMLPGGVKISHTSQEAATLARFWKGATQGSSHPTGHRQHAPVNEPELDAALGVIIQHLDNTIYANAPEKVVALALKPPS